MTLAIVLIDIGRSGISLGAVGYTLFMVSHIMRAVATLYGSPLLFIFGELMRPLSLVVIAAAVTAKGGRRV